MDIDLAEKLFQFAVNVIKFLRHLPNEPEFNNIRFQLSKSSSSSGANYEEAQGAVSRPDFGNKVAISLKEMREADYWLRILKELYPNNAEVERLVKESFELKNILGSICVKVSRR